MSNSRHIQARELKEALAKEGYRYVRSNANGHFVFEHPDVVGQLVAGTSSDPRGLHNALTRARRMKRAVTESQHQEEAMMEQTPATTSARLTPDEQTDAIAALRASIDRNLPLMRYVFTPDKPEDKRYYQWFLGYVQRPDARVPSQQASWLVDQGMLQSAGQDSEFPRKTFFVPTDEARRLYEAPPPATEESAPEEPAESTGLENVAAEVEQAVAAMIETQAPAPVPPSRERMVAEILAPFDDAQVKTILHYGIMAYQDDVKRERDKLAEMVERRERELRLLDDILSL